MVRDQLKQPGTLAKVLLLFFAVLFIAVLIHPDVDLLDVHDVKITGSRSQFRSVEGQLLQQASFLFARPEASKMVVLERLAFAIETISSCDVAAISVLRI
jgi:hypothetical protein